MPDFSDYIVYVDESGDHGLHSINPEFPVFVLAFCVFKQSQKETIVVFESRGKKEDNELELEFRRVCDGLNFRGERMNLNCVIASKLSNSCGLQLADLIARPIARKIIKPEQENRAYDIIEKKFDRSSQGVIQGWGLKTYP